MSERRDIRMAVAELSLSGGISLGKCSARTLSRWVKDINEYLERERADWRVIAVKSDSTIVVA